jgi:hypothetical protein
MKKLVTLLATLLLFVSAAPTEAMVINDGSGSVTRQCTYITTAAPGRADNWPYCGIYTSKAYNTSNPGAIAGKASAHPTSGYNAVMGECDQGATITTICWGWESIGDFGTWKIQMGMSARTYWPPSPNGSTYFKVYCDLTYATVVTITLGTCGKIAESSTDYVVGLNYTSKTPDKYGIPATTVGWRTYVRCYKFTGTCDQPVSKRPV